MRLCDPAETQDCHSCSRPPASLDLTAEIVAAHLSFTSITPEAVPALIEGVHRALATAGASPALAAAPTPAVPVRRSVFPDHIICLEDGKKLKMLKRHLLGSYGMTPDAYRTKWGLPPDYPMVAPAYARFRSELAKKTGLGRLPGEEPAIVVEPEVTKLPARRAKGLPRP